ncbi:hypothetical protein [Vibrio sp. VB16]|uniref:hypothetical protein n=1 Tax=Vibrio sp. VB16 TaxID=2785746 RepID=UPI00189DEBCC|nr:hypothetical protein [Vibrio sp. VB16]UGA53576.1 hypothetical protein IUZ65_009710 [Vibrio sp. VB16]
MSDEIRREFIARIEDLKDQIYIQMIALILVLIFFYSKVLKDKKHDTTFVKMLKDIRADIETSALEGDAKKARLHELEEINSNLLGLKSMYKSTPMFLMGYGFWAISLFMFGYRMFTGAAAA